MKFENCTRKRLEGCTKAELLAHAKSWGVKAFASMKKDKIVEVLLQAKRKKPRDAKSSVGGKNPRHANGDQEITPEMLELMNLPLIPREDNILNYYFHNTDKTSLDDYNALKDIMNNVFQIKQKNDSTGDEAFSDAIIQGGLEAVERYYDFFVNGTVPQALLQELRN